MNIKRQVTDIMLEAGMMVMVYDHEPKALAQMLRSAQMNVNFLELEVVEPNNPGSTLFVQVNPDKVILIGQQHEEPQPAPPTSMAIGGQQAQPQALAA